MKRMIVKDVKERQHLNLRGTYGSICCTYTYKQHIQHICNIYNVYMHKSFNYINSLSNKPAWNLDTKYMYLAALLSTPYFPWRHNFCLSIVLLNASLNSVDCAIKKVSVTKQWSLRRKNYNQVSKKFTQTAGKCKIFKTSQTTTPMQNQ